MKTIRMQLQTQFGGTALLSDLMHFLRELPLRQKQNRLPKQKEQKLIQDQVRNNFGRRMEKNVLKSFFLFFNLFCFANFSFAQCTTKLGVYYWGGQLNGVDTSAIIPRAKILADSLNVNTIRI